MGSPASDRPRLLAAAGLAVLTAILGLLLLSPNGLVGNGLVQASYDTLHRLAGEESLSNCPVVIVYLDLQSYRALAIDPKAVYARFLYGLEAYLTNDMKEALPRFQRAHQLNPGDSRTALYLGLTTESLGQPEQALALYEEAVRLETAAGALRAETLLPGARLHLLLGRLEESERISQTEHGETRAAPEWCGEDAPDGERKPRRRCHQSSH